VKTPNVVQLERHPGRHVQGLDISTQRWLTRPPPIPYMEIYRTLKLKLTRVHPTLTHRAIGGGGEERTFRRERDLKPRKIS